MHKLWLPAGRRPSYSAFTLVEVLVVIMIISILIVLSISGISKALKTARATRSVSNIRQLCTAYQAYAADNNGNYPSAQGPPWMLQVYPYVYPSVPSDQLVARNFNTLLTNTIFISPGLTSALVTEFGYDSKKLQNWCYGFNINLPIIGDQGVTIGNGRAQYVFNPRMIEAPAAACLFMTGCSYTVGFGENLAEACKAYNNTLHVGYADGHAAVLSTNQIPVGDSFSASEKNLFWYGYNK